MALVGHVRSDQRLGFIFAFINHSAEMLAERLSWTISRIALLTCCCRCCCCCGARLRAKLLWQTLEISLGRGRGCPSLHRLFQSAAVFPWWLLGTSTSALLFLAPHCIFCTLVTPFRQSCWHSELVACSALIVIGQVSKHPFCCLLSCPSSLTLLCRTLLLLDVGVLDVQTCAWQELWQLQMEQGSVLLCCPFLRLLLLPCLLTHSPGCLCG